MYIDKLDEPVNKYNNTYNRAIKIKSSMYIDFNKENYKEDPKFKIDGNVRISKYKNVFAKGYVPNTSEEFFVISKVKNTFLWTYVNDLMVAEIVGTFYEKELQIIKQK